MGNSHCPACDDARRTEVEQELHRLIDEFDAEQTLSAKAGQRLVAEAWASARIAIEGVLYG